MTPQRAVFRPRRVREGCQREWRGSGGEDDCAATVQFREETSKMRSLPLLPDIPEEMEALV
jgi:hypothetical protein